MWRNKQYDAEIDGNISLQTAGTLQRRGANDALYVTNLPSMYARNGMHTALCFLWKWNIHYSKCLLNIKEPNHLSQMRNNIQVSRF